VRIRAPVVRVFDRGETTTVIGATGTRTFEGDSAALVRAVLEIHGTPCDRARLFAALAQASGGEVPAAPVDQLVELLVADRVLIDVVAPKQKPASEPRRVVVAITGAIAAIDAPSLIRALQASGCVVRAAVSKTAKKLVSIAALEALTHHRVASGIWERRERQEVPHIELAEWAELVVVCPASATTIARIAHGECSDLVAAIAVATRAPVVIVPSMNDAMYASPPVQANLETLRGHGRVVVHPALGDEVAHAPDARRAMFGPAPPAGAIADIVRTVLAETPRKPLLPTDAAGWERAWASNAPRPWRIDALDAPLAEAIARAGGTTLLDLGCGDGVVAIHAATHGLHVTATEISPTALGLARERAGTLPILFVLDDIRTTRLRERVDIAFDRGVLHGIARSDRAAYATAIERLVVRTLIVIAHTADVGLGTHPVTAADLEAMFPAWRIDRATATELAGKPATAFELRRIITEP